MLKYSDDGSQRRRKFDSLPAADGRAEVALYARDGNVWLTQQQMAELFATSKQNAGKHIANLFAEAELEENSVVKNFLTTASDGN